jgi:hypothetical protein
VVNEGDVPPFNLGRNVFCFHALYLRCFCRAVHRVSHHKKRDVFACIYKSHWLNIH